MNTASLKGRIHSAQHLLPGVQTAPPNWVIPAVKVWVTRSLHIPPGPDLYLELGLPTGRVVGMAVV